jgi:hypothetical protein
MQPASTDPGVLAGDRQRVLAVGGLPVEVASQQPDEAAAPEVEGRDQLRVAVTGSW